MFENAVLARKIKRIEAGIVRLFKKQVGIDTSIWSYGAYEIDPKYLVFVIRVDTDKTRDRLRADEALKQGLFQLLVEEDWPEPAREHVHFSIESEETVQRESGGNWFYHYK